MNRIKKAFAIPLLITLHVLMLACTPQPRAELAENALTIETLDLLEVTGEFGEGLALSATYGPDGKTIAVYTTRGLYLYDSASMMPIPFGGENRPIDRYLFSPDGKLLALVLQASLQIEVWDLATNTQRYTLGDQKLRRQFLSFSPKGERLMANTGLGLTVWDMETGQSVSNIDLSPWRNVLDISYASNGARIGGLVASELFTDKVALWSPDTGSLNTMLAPPDEDLWLSGGRFSPSGSRYAAVASTENGTTPSSLLIWDLNRPENRPISIQPQGGLFQESYAFTPDGQRLVISNNQGGIEQWDLDSEALVSTVSRGAAPLPSQLVVGDSGTDLLLIDSSGQIEGWDIENGQQIFQQALGTDQTIDTNHSAHSALITDRFGTLTQIDLRSGDIINQNSSHRSGPVEAIDISPDGRQIATATGNGRIGLWEWEAGYIGDLPGQPGHLDTLRYHPTENQIASGLGERLSALAFDDSIRVWEADPTSASPILEIIGAGNDVPGCSTFENNLLYASTGETLFSVSHDYSIKVWSAATGQLQTQLVNHVDAVLDIVLSHDDQTLYSASEDGKIIAWSTRGGDVEFEISGDAFGYASLALSPDGSTLAAGSNTGDLFLYSTRNGRLIKRLEGKMNPRSDLTFSADGDMLIAGSEGNQLTFWAVESGEAVRQAPLGESQIKSLRLSQDGSRLAVGALDGTLYFLSLGSG